MRVRRHGGLVREGMWKGMSSSVWVVTCTLDLGHIYVYSQALLMIHLP